MKSTATLILAAALVGCARKPAPPEPSFTGETPAPAPAATPEATTTTAMAITAPMAVSPVDAAGYMAQAVISDQYEIQSSQLALTRAQSEPVREFARMMIDHHMKTTESLVRASQEAGLTLPPPMVDERRAALINELEAATTDFDGLYLQQQRMAHEEALTLHSNYAISGDTPALQAAAAAAVPIIEQHRAQLNSLDVAAIENEPMTEPLSPTP